MSGVTPHNSYKPGWWHLREASAMLHQGGLVAYPTEAVWGLGCDPFNEPAVAALLELKQRPWDKGLILVAASISQVEDLLGPLSPAQSARAEEHWPGPVTCVIPDPQSRVPEGIRGRHASVAVRVSAHPLVRRLCETFGGAVVSTSCNPAGRPPARQRWQVKRYFPDALDYCLPGSLGGQRQPSRIIDLQTGYQWR